MLLRCVVVIITSVILVSCGGREAVKPSSLSVPSPDALTQNEIDNTLLLENSSSVVTNDSLISDSVSNSYKGDYIIGSGDLIDIDVYQVAELKRTLRISASGFIKLPLAGKIKASGLTARELETEINKRYEPYLQEPVVSIFIKEYRSQKITVLGAVKSPKVHTVRSQNYLLDLLSLSGGLSENAGEIGYVRRGSETIIINLDELLVKGNAELNVPVFAGDVIHFSVGGILFVDGAVRSPGSFPVSGNISLTQVISLAKGFSETAIKSEVKVYRDTGKEKRDVIPVDYDDILAQKAPDVILRDKDIIIVPESPFIKFIRSISGVTRIGSVSLSGGL